MQLGTRWSIGDDAPSSLPEVVLLAVKTVENDLAQLDTETGEWRWTLTWLEGRPVIELDDGTTINYNATEDAATIVLPGESVDDPFDDDDD